jgi:hypothetical protein
MTRRSSNAIFLATFLCICSGMAWYVWAAFEYVGLSHCPWGTPQAGHPWEVGLALSIGAGLIMARKQLGEGSFVGAFAVGVGTAVLAGAFILVIAVMVGGGLRCQD